MRAPGVCAAAAGRVYVTFGSNDFAKHLVCGMKLKKRETRVPDHQLLDGSS